MAATLVIPPNGTGPFLIYTWSTTPSTAFASTETVIHGEQNGPSGTSYGDLATPGPAATVTVPASGKVRLYLSCSYCQNDGGNSGGGYMSYAMSGANTASPNDNTSLFLWINGASGAAYSGGVWSTLLTGLTPGSTTFTVKYRNPANQANQGWNERRIRIEPVDADQG